MKKQLMQDKLVAGVLLGASALFAAGSAFATTVASPAGSSPLPFTAAGPVHVKVAGVIIPCTASVSATVVADGTVSVSNFKITGSSGSCSLAVPQNLPYSGRFDYNGGSPTLTIDNVDFHTIFSSSDCGPTTIVAPYTNGAMPNTPGLAALNNITMPPLGCIISPPPYGPEKLSVTYDGTTYGPVVGP